MLRGSVGFNFAGEGFAWTPADSGGVTVGTAVPPLNPVLSPRQICIPTAGHALACWKQSAMRGQPLRSASTLCASPPIASLQILANQLRPGMTWQLNGKAYEAEVSLWVGAVQCRVYRE